MTTDRNIQAELDRIMPSLKRAENVFDATYCGFNPKKLMDTLKEQGYDGYGARFKLRGYDLLICSPMKVYIRFSGGYLWFGSYGILTPDFNDAYDCVVGLISEVIDAGIETDYEGIRLERLRQKMLKAIGDTTRNAAGVCKRKRNTL